MIVEKIIFLMLIILLPRNRQKLYLLVYSRINIKGEYKKGNRTIAPSIYVDS